MSPTLKEKTTPEKTTPEKTAREKTAVTAQVKPSKPGSRRAPAAQTNDSLPTIETASNPALDTAWQVVWLPVAQIDPNPYQPRTTFDAAEMEEMVASVKAYGVLQPVTVRTIKPDEGPPKAGEDHENGSASGLANANGHANGG